MRCSRNRRELKLGVDCSKMSQPSPVSLSKRLIKVESRARTGSDPTIYSLKKSNLEKVPSADSIVGQPCLKCTNKCHGFMPHVWRKVCITCGCSRDSHMLDSDPHETLPYLEGLDIQNGHNLSGQEQRIREKYSWYPSGLSPDMVEQYMQCLPREKVPLRGSDGEKLRIQQFIRQLPSYDSSLEACHKMADLDKKRMTKFIEKRKTSFFGLGEVDTMTVEESKQCTGCSELIDPGSVYVIAERAKEKAWHPQCFKCDTCNELLVDLIYFYSPEKDAIYCGRHHGETIIPRCTGCDELIFSKTLTESGGKNYHKEHLCCIVCDTSLHQKTFTEANSRLYCKSCYSRTAASLCQKCREPIGIGAKTINAKGASWHRECFICKRCREDLSEERYFLIDGDLLCGECVEPVAQCYGCKSSIIPTVSFLTHKTRSWHAECFKCVLCRAWLVDGGFQELDDSLMCNTCYVEKVGKKCSVCDKPIVGKGVQFCLSVYHPDCFRCGFCNRPLAGESIKVKEREGRPICSECILRSAQKCFRCHQPITSKHTVYRERPFHLQCFTCNLCGSSVAKSEFFETSLREILCYQCAKIR